MKSNLEGFRTTQSYYCNDGRTHYVGGILFSTNHLIENNKKAFEVFHVFFMPMSGNIIRVFKRINHPTYEIYVDEHPIIEQDVLRGYCQDIQEEFKKIFTGDYFDRNIYHE